jgi:hypothetical protein
VDPNPWRLAFVIPTIVGLVALARRAGLGPRGSSALALTLGLGVRLAYAAATGAAEPQAWLEAAVQGLTLGVAAAGLARRRTEERA